MCVFYSLDDTMLDSVSVEDEEKAKIEELEQVIQVLRYDQYQELLEHTHTLICYIYCESFIVIDHVVYIYRHQLALSAKDGERLNQTVQHLERDIEKQKLTESIYKHTCNIVFS